MTVLASNPGGPDNEPVDVCSGGEVVLGPGQGRTIIVREDCWVWWDFGYDEDRPTTSPAQVKDYDLLLRRGRRTGRIPLAGGSQRLWTPGYYELDWQSTDAKIYGTFSATRAEHPTILWATDQDTPVPKLYQALGGQTWYQLPNLAASTYFVQFLDSNLDLLVPIERWNTTDDAQPPRRIPPGSVWVNAVFTAAPTWANPTRAGSVY